jgi:TolA-binding protein
MKKLIKTTGFLLLLSTLSSCGFMEHVEHRAAVLNSLEDKVIALNQENSQLRNEIMSLKYKLKTVESRNFYLETQLQNKNAKKAPTMRVPASVKKVSSNDLVKFDVYKWKPSQMLAIAEKEFDAKNYEKSAQFFNELTAQFPGNEVQDDKFLFQAGVASFETGKHYQWSEKYFNNLITNYPTSKFYLGAKLWLGMSYLKQDKKKEFFAVVEEFRKKYRNTPEWNILSGHYEKIVQNYKSN